MIQLWRYPVKSLQGEQMDSSTITPEGLDGDRRFALFDVQTGFGLTARRHPELLFASARANNGDRPLVTHPDGSLAPDDAALSAWLGRPVELRAAQAPSPTARQYENPVDFEAEEGAWAPFEGAAGPFHDSGRARVSLLSTSTLRGWDPRRFRANVVLDGGGEDDLVGRQVDLGGARLSVSARLARCVMTTRPQPGGIDRDLDVLRTINQERAGCLAVGARVVAPGRVAVGDGITVS